ncbi:MAG: protein-glutamate O-methyltransferase CheR [Planctomycetes bacterium]|nr:protein-glutamate O-methyltransferase CheR [Planctomycetota bacterium]
MSGNNPLQLIQLTDKEFDLLSSLVYNQFGIKLGLDKKVLLSTRLQKVLKNLGLDNFEDYYHHLRKDKTGKALSALANRISTNHTFFYREPAHFELLSSTVLPEIIAKHRSISSKDLRVWCAASSSGEEPYMLMMLLMEALGSEYKQWSCGLLATDISETALNTAKGGVYSKEQIEPLPEKFQSNYFKAMDEDSYSVIPELKSEITYRRFNLMNTTLPFKKAFDVIFIRNVMIYFDASTKTALVNRLKDFMNPGGYLFLGMAETLPKGVQGFEGVSPSVYRKKTSWV